MNAVARRPLAYLVVPLVILPFALAVIFERQTDFLPDLLVNLLFFPGRHILPLSYLYKVLPDGLESVLSEPQHTVFLTHWRDLVAWAFLSILYGLCTQRLRLRYSLLLAPLFIFAMVYIFEQIAWHFGYVVWGIPIRVVG